MIYDVLFRNGELIDPGGGYVGRADLAIQAGRVAAIEPAIDPALATRVIDISGRIITPGLVDLHTHIYWGVTYWGIEPDPLAARTGVTTWLDAGSAGAYSFPGFRRYVAQPSRARIFALLNLSAIGLIAPTWEFANLDYCDLDLAARMVAEHRDLILGIKARIDQNTTRGTGLRPLELARNLADRVDLPLMVHIGSGPPDLDQIGALLRPGDILTHCFTGGTHRIVNQAGAVNPMVRALQEQGVLLDLGHGTGSFAYAVAEQSMAQGIIPDVISSDIHQLSIQGPMFDLPTTLSKFLNLGMSLPDVIARATIHPARAMRRPDLGMLAVGSVADLAIFRIERGEQTFYDVQMERRTGDQRLICEATFVAGVELPFIEPVAPAIWAELPAHQRTQ